MQNRLSYLQIPAGLPSTLLEQRPDVKAAENMLIAETEKIGVAQAMRLPSFSLTGLFGLASADVSTLLTGDALAGGLTGMIMGPIFEFGKNKRRVDIQRAEAEIAVNRIIWILTAELLVMLKMHLMAFSHIADEYTARITPG